MCADYWNLKVDLKCPKCGKENEWELQTHWMGNNSSNEVYSLHQPIPLLKGSTRELNRESDWFIDSCPSCEEFIDWGASVVNGVVTRVYYLGLEQKSDAQSKA